MSDHNNPNLGRTLDEITQTILNSADNDTLIAVQEERKACEEIALEFGDQRIAIAIRERGE